MEDLLQNLAKIVELGKICKDTPYPPELKGQDGASELTLAALEKGIEPQIILNQGLTAGMKSIGDKFEKGEAFIPNMLIAAKAMNAAMEHLQPFFTSGSIESKGTLIIGTVKGDLHDIGKNLVKMIVKGSGWQVVDLGTDVSAEQFIQALEEHTGAIIGMSALLTTTMMQMDGATKTIKDFSPDTKVYVGGAPVSQNYCDQIGADGYFADPSKFTKHLATF